MSRWSRPKRLSWIASPFAIWGLHFFGIYSIQGLVCARGWQAGGVWAGIGVATLAAFAAVAWIGLRARRLAGADGEPAEKRFAARLVAMLSLLSLVAMVFTIVPALLLHPCE